MASERANTSEPPPHATRWGCENPHLTNSASAAGHVRGRRSGFVDRTHKTSLLSCPARQFLYSRTPQTPLRSSSSSKPSCFTPTATRNPQPVQKSLAYGPGGAITFPRSDTSTQSLNQSTQSLSELVPIPLPTRTRATLTITASVPPAANVAVVMPKQRGQSCSLRPGGRFARPAASTNCAMKIRREKAVHAARDGSAFHAKCRS